MEESHDQKLLILGRTALVIASSYLIVLGCLLLEQAFESDQHGSLVFIDKIGEEQAAKGYFFHVITGLLMIVWYSRGSRSKFPIAFACLACLVAGMWTYISFTPTFFGLTGLIPGAFCLMVFGYRLRSRAAAKSS